MTDHKILDTIHKDCQVENLEDILGKCVRPDGVCRTCRREYDYGMTNSPLKYIDVHGVLGNRNSNCDSDADKMVLVDIIQALIEYSNSRAFTSFTGYDNKRSGVVDNDSRAKPAATS